MTETVYSKEAFDNRQNIGCFGGPTEMTNQVSYNFYEMNSKKKVKKRCWKTEDKIQKIFVVHEKKNSNTK